MRKKLKENGLSLVLLALFLISLVGQVIAGWKDHNDDRHEEGKPPLSFSAYLGSGHFGEALFENWESEFLQMGLYVGLTIFLKQKGCPESKPIEGPSEVDREPDPKRKGAPWPVRKGGLWARLYSSSLTVALLLLFVFSFVLHAVNGARAFNDEQAMKHQPPVSLGEFMSGSHFWFQSFQNWQSEFLSIAALVILSVFLRQRGSPESKPVDAPHDETGSEG